jgi:hypothetical protein
VVSGRCLGRPEKARQKIQQEAPGEGLIVMGKYTAWELAELARLAELVKKLAHTAANSTRCEVSEK